MSSWSLKLILMPESWEDMDEVRSDFFAMAPVYGKPGPECSGLGAVAAVDETDEFGRGNDSDRCLSISADLGRFTSGVISL